MLHYSTYAHILYCIPSEKQIQYIKEKHEPKTMHIRSRGQREEEKPHTHTLNAPRFSYTNRVVLQSLKLGQWLLGACYRPMVALMPAPLPPSDSNPVSFHHCLAWQTDTL